MRAVFQRNFAAYFLNPTGYVFLCVFTLACSCAAFLPDDFVNSNLANLDQLNLRFPLILLVFIPSVTMGVWADERRFGTDELLLSAPLSVGDIVIGKYFAALAVYLVSLTFASLSNAAVLSFLGSPDFGLFWTTCLGYALVGSAMLALGMFASFFSPQLTVAYLAGVFINVPLVALQWADALPIGRSDASALKEAGIANFFEPFGSGSVSAASVIYFLSVTAIALWLCAVMIDRRWKGARRPCAFAAHTIFRLLAFVAIAVALTALVNRSGWRSDWTAERLGTLSPATIEALDAFRSDWPVTLEAYFSGDIPPEYIKTRTDIAAFLNTMKNRLHGKAFLSVRRVEPNTQAAWQLEKRYDIRPKRVVYDERGQAREVPVFLTVVVRSGPKTSVIPFMHRGLSVEYELLSAILSVSNQPKKRLGVLVTDAALFGRTDSFGAMAARPWPILEELAKRYTITAVDPTDSIDPNTFDVLLAVQPSTLTQEGMMNFLAVVRQGTPTLIFEDPWPLFVGDVLPGTYLPKRPSMPNFTLPKGDIGPLWSLLGVLFGTDLVWNNYNPYPKMAALSPEFVFVDARPMTLGPPNKKSADGEKEPEDVCAFNPNEPAVASLEHLLFPFTGSIVADRAAGTVFEPLIRTRAGGTASVDDIVSLGIRSQARSRTDRKGIYTLCAKITGPVPRLFQRTNEKTPPNLNVLLTADVDLLTGGFFALREMGTDVQSGVTLDFDNVTFILNAVDRLSGDDALIAVRSRRTHHRRLDAVERATQPIRDQASAEQIAVQKDFENECRAAEAKLNERIAELFNQGEFADGENPEKSPQLQSMIQAMQRRLEILRDEKKEEYDKKSEETRRRLDESVRKIQGSYKLMAVALPPILPLLIGLGVALRRRAAAGRDRRETP